MKTPITDAAAFDVEATNWDNSIEKNQCPNGDYVESKLARRLELDRAALMDMISKIIDYRDDDYVPNSIFEQAERTLIKVRANFPES